MNTDQLRNALRMALDALDAPDPEPTDVPDVSDIIEAEGEADAERIAAEAEADAKRIEAESKADAERIAAEADAEVKVIEAEADAEVEVIAAEVEAVDQADDDDEPYECDGELPDMVDSLADDLADIIEDGANVLDGPEDDAPLGIEDIAPAATHWYTRKRSFRR